MAIDIDSVSLQREPSEFIPVTIVGLGATAELTIALHEHAVEYSGPPAGPGPSPTKPRPPLLFSMGHIDAVGCVPVLKPPVVPGIGVMVELAPYIGSLAVDDAGCGAVLKLPVVPPVGEMVELSPYLENFAAVVICNDQ